MWTQEDKKYAYGTRLRWETAAALCGIPRMNIDIAPAPDRDLQLPLTFPVVMIVLTTA
jgi:hypothetical protein